MMKKNIKILILITTIFLFTGCTALLDSMGIFTEPKFEEINPYEIYGLIENGKINRYGASKNDIDKVKNVIHDKYGINVNSYWIESTDGKNRIKFYNDFKVITQGKEYTVSKPPMKEFGGIYEYKLPVNRVEWEADIILDIGEIELYDKNRKVIKEKTKIPTMPFRRATIAKITYYDRDVMGRDYDVLYQGWKENYDPSKLKKLFHSYDTYRSIYSE